MVVDGHPVKKITVPFDVALFLGVSRDDVVHAMVYRVDLLGISSFFEDLDFLGHQWYARENDVIGGWCVMPVDQPPSSGVPEVADFCTKEHAEHVAELHNRWLEAEREQG